MRVLHIYKTFYPDSFGGIEEVIFQLCKGMSHHGFESDVFALSVDPSKTDCRTYNGVRVYQARRDINISSTPMSFEAYGKLKNIINNYDILHLHYPYPFADILTLMLSPNLPVILTYHADVVSQKYLKYLYAPIEQHFLKKVDKIVCTSPNYFKSSKNLQKFQNKVETILLGLPEKSKVIEIKSNSKFNQFKNVEPFILFLGGLRNYKGLENLIEAAKTVKTNIIIAGGSQRLKFYEKLVCELGLTNIFFTGHINEDEKYFFLKHCLALILPSSSRAEGFGLVQLEAAMMSKALVSTELGTGTSFVNLHKETGLVIKPNNPSEIADAINYLYNNPEETIAMGRRSRQRYLRYFTSEEMCKNYNRIYQMLLGDQKA